MAGKVVRPEVRNLDGRPGKPTGIVKAELEVVSDIDANGERVLEVVLVFGKTQEKDGLREGVYTLLNNTQIKENLRIASPRIAGYVREQRALRETVTPAAIPESLSSVDDDEG